MLHYLEGKRADAKMAWLGSRMAGRLLPGQQHPGCRAGPPGRQNALHMGVERAQMGQLGMLMLTEGSHCC